MDRQEWLAGLKVGDEVFLRGYGFRSSVIGKVAKRTPAGKIDIDCGTYTVRCNSGGCEIGNGYSRVRMEPVTDENREQIERGDLVSKLCQVKWSDLPLEKLRRVLAVVEE